MAKKKKYKAQKTLFNQIAKGLSIITGIDFGIGSRYENGTWYCGFGSELEIPHWFDATIRDSAADEIKPYIQKQYDKIIDALKSRFGDIEHSPSKDWFNFTYHFPPDGIAFPEEWEHVDGVFQKVKDARLLTLEEIEERIKYWKSVIEKEKQNKYSMYHLESLQWERDNWQKYFKFVGGSPFTDELFVHISYAPMIRMRGEFSFKAFGDFIPSDGYMYHI